MKFKTTSMASLRKRAASSLIIKAYRQELRDFINDNKERILNGDKIELPKQPDFIDLNIIY